MSITKIFLTVLTSISLNSFTQAELLTELHLYDGPYKYSLVGICDNTIYLSSRDIAKTYLIEIEGLVTDIVAGHFERLNCYNNGNVLLVSDNEALNLSNGLRLQFDAFPEFTNSRPLFAKNGKTYSVNLADGTKHLVFEKNYTDATYLERSDCYVFTTGKEIYRQCKSHVELIDFSLPNPEGPLAPINIRAVSDQFAYVSVLNYADKTWYDYLYDGTEQLIEFTRQTPESKRYRSVKQLGSSLFLGKLFIGSIENLDPLQYLYFKDVDYLWNYEGYIYTFQKDGSNIVIERYRALMP
ncbi:hypothetical protein [Reinekea sp. G2M2-21]|uniref:hypothetical protein n=1 Tax=Reinekea sp. G2M2-21 TaxID=2788942 RepID=UPI0018A88AD7|nr:hypothetical protein [Reinekea sp. G2M2-21]